MIIVTNAELSGYRPWGAFPPLSSGWFVSWTIPTFLTR